MSPTPAAAGKICPNCQRPQLYGVTSVHSKTGDAELPKEGEPLICDNCMCVHTVDAEGNYRPFYREEWMAIQNNALVMAQLLQAMQTITRVKERRHRYN